MGYFPESFLKGIEWVFFFAAVGLVIVFAGGIGLIFWGAYECFHHLKWI